MRVLRMKKVRVRRMECPFCDWHTWGFKDNIRQTDFDKLLKKTADHIREVHNKHSPERYGRMPFMPDDYPLENDLKHGGA